VDGRGWIEALGFERHVEGGWFGGLWTHPETDADGRALASSILYLLEAGDRSHWHRFDAEEMWLWHAGGPLALRIVTPDGSRREHVLGDDPGAGQVLQAVVPAHSWQSAEPLDGTDYALVTCMVVPEFLMATHELAPPGWSPPVA
jgi:predicted cupin superfamily sugar epimerase